jgi:hypothetical protein
VKELILDCTFTAWENQTVELAQIVAFTKFDAFTSKLRQHFLMLDKCPLNS